MGLLLLHGLLVLVLNGRDDGVHAHLHLGGVAAVDLDLDGGAAVLDGLDADLVGVVDGGEPALGLEDEVVGLVVAIVELELAVDLEKK